MTDEGRRLRKRAARRRRAAERRLTPIRGRAARRLRTGGGPQRVVGLAQFAEGVARKAARSSRPSRSGVTRWLLAALPVAVVVLWAVARLTRHL